MKGADRLESKPSHGRRHVRRKQGNNLPDTSWALQYRQKLSPIGIREAVGQLGDNRCTGHESAVLNIRDARYRKRG